MGLNQKGAVNLLIPAAILVATAIIASSNITTSTNNGALVKGVLIAKSENGNGNSGNNNGSQNNQGGRSDEAKEKNDARAAQDDNNSRNNGNQEKDDRKNNKSSIQQQRNESTKEAELEDDEDNESSESADINELRSISKFPLRIDTATNQLIMTKDGVERVLTVLPAKAVQNMLRAHLKKGLGPKFFGNATPSATPTSTPSASSGPVATESANITVLENQISLEDDNGQPVYKIPAKQQLRLLGLLPITTDLTGYVSAQTGAIIREQQSLLARLLALLSF